MTYPILLIILGVAILTVAWLPSILEKYPLSYPVIYVALGWLLYMLPLELPDPNPLHHQTLTTHLTEICVTVALTSTGLKIDRKFSWSGWRVPLRLASLTMVLTIGLIAWTGWWLVGLAPAAALLLGAALAPTDPVLAGDVQVGDPGEGGEDDVRFALTGEAGFNDGLAFPFVHLAIALTATAVGWQELTGHWLLKDVLYRILVGVAVGWAAGRLLAYLIFGLPKRISIKSSAYGFVVLAITLTTYGLTELLHGYGFLAVFISALAIRSYERTHEYHQHMHAFSDQIERLFIVVLLIWLGGAAASGIFRTLTWEGIVLGVFLVLVIRPLVGYLTLVRSGLNKDEKWVIAGFGIRGIGSIYYLAYAVEKGKFQEAEVLWSILAFVVVLSITLHGILATPVMTWLDRRYDRLELDKSPPES